MNTPHTTKVKNELPTPVRAALLMLGSTMFFGLMVVAIRLASASLHAFEIAFFRNFFGLLVALPLLLRHGPGFLRTTQFPRYLFRCLIGMCSMLAGFWAISHLPLAQAVSLSYSTPLFVTIAAAALLGAQVRVPVHKALGRVCAMPTVSCPPAIPVAVSGEEITPAAIVLMQRYGIEELSVLR